MELKELVFSFTSSTGVSNGVARTADTDTVGKGEASALRGDENRHITPLYARVSRSCLPFAC